MPVNPIIWRKYVAGEIEMPFLYFAPYCESCGAPVEQYEGVPVESINPHQTFLCRDCDDMDCGYKRFAKQNMESGTWSEIQAEAFMKSCILDL